MMSTPTAIHVPLDPMTLEIHPVSSSHVSWVYKWSNVDLSSKVESFSSDFGHANGWAWRLLLQHHTNPDGNRVYSLFLYVVLTDTELREPTWTRKIRVMQFQILNSEGRRLKDKSTIALFNEHQLTWGFPALIDNAHLMRDPIVAATKKVDIICRLRYLPEYEKIRRPMSPPVSGVYGRSFDSADLSDHNAAAKVFDPRAVVVDSVGSSLRMLVNNPTFSDIQIIVGPERQLFHGHKAILAARSVWFESALNPLYREAHEGVIRLPEEDPKIFEMLFEFLYTGDYPLATVATMGLLPAPTTGSPVPKIATIKTERRTSRGNTPSTTPSPPPNIRPFQNDKSTNGFTYTYDDERDLEEHDDTRFQLYLMADKYGVSQLKCLIRVHLTNELLDPASGVQSQSQGQRLLKLIRFAFEELPEAVNGSVHEFSSRNALECPTDLSTLSSATGARLRDSGLGEELIDDGGLADRVVSPGVPGFERVYARGGTAFSTNSPPASSGLNTNSTPDGSNAARVLSSVFAPPPPPTVTLPLGNGPNSNNNTSNNSSGNNGTINNTPSTNSTVNRCGGGSSTVGNTNTSSSSPSNIPSTLRSPSGTPGPSSGAVSGGGVGLFGNGSGSSTIGYSLTAGSGSTISPSLTPNPIAARTDLVHQRDTPSRIADRDTRRTDSRFGFRGGWQSSASNMSSSTSGIGGRQGRYGRDNETALLREAIVAFVAKMFPAVRRIDGFEDLMKEGGDMGGFATEVMDRMFRP
ncbi:hypothetical protein BDZ91DRAFT_543553 [Kalaharituber pfeilii]|nr:hypothetical protein BDZ91DRAFT_543553 [Kalaharituber pfeilii]